MSHIALPLWQFLDPRPDIARFPGAAPDGAAGRPLTRRWAGFTVFALGASSRGSVSASMAIRDITSRELTLFGDIVGRLGSLPPSADVRVSVFSDIVRLVRGDFGASYVWQAATGESKDAVNFNMDPANLRRYETWFQFRDPMTAKLRSRRTATPVDAVIPQAELERTEFFNDFL